MIQIQTLAANASYLSFSSLIRLRSNVISRLRYIIHVSIYNTIHACQSIWLTSFSACLSAFICRSKLLTASNFARSADRFAQLFRRLLAFCARTVAVFLSFQFLPTWNPSTISLLEHDLAPISPWNKSDTWYSTCDSFNNTSFSYLDILILCTHNV